MSELPEWRIKRQVVEGRCRVVHCLTPVMVDTLLDAAGVEAVDKLPRAILRGFCRHASPSGMERLFEQAEREHPDQVGVVLGADERGNGMIVTSGDVGFDMLRRFAPIPDPAEDALCDPDLSPVELELRVWNPAEPAEVDVEGNVGVGRLLFRTVVAPPDLT